MSNIIIAYGQHRNEMVAARLAPLVADVLKKQGHDIELIGNPEERTLQEVVRQTEGRKLKTKEVEKILHKWEDKNLVREYPGTPIFLFHNHNINPTDFEDQLYVDSFLTYRRETWPHFDTIPPTREFPFAEEIYFYVDNDNGPIIALEIPHIQRPTLSAQIEKVCKNRMTKKAFERYRSYLYDSNIDESRNKGFLGEEMVKTLSTGLHYILTNGLGEFSDFLE